VPLPNRAPHGVLDFDIEGASLMLLALVDVPAAKRDDTLAVVVKVFLERGNKYSDIGDVWDKLCATRMKNNEQVNLGDE
jgi:hypothetical protein